VRHSAVTIHLRRPSPSAWSDLPEN